MFKREDLSTDQYNQHWHTTHAELAKNLPTLLGYHQSEVLGAAIPGFARAPFDGIAEDWFEDFKAAIGLQSDPDYIHYLLPDEPRFVTRFEWTVADEEVITGPVTRGGSAKGLLFLKRAAELGVDEFKEVMQAGAASLAPKLEGIDAFAQSFAVAEMYDGAEPFADAVAELWWPDVEAFGDSSESVMSLVAPYFLPALDPGSSNALLVEEHVVIPAPGSPRQRP
jgi:hypothetical protein